MKIQTTTSRQAKNAKDDEKENKFVHDDACRWIAYLRQNHKKGKKQRAYPSYIRIDFWEREWFLEMPLYLLYKVARIVFISFWFYFSPFIAMTLQFYIPFAQLTNKTKNGA